MINKQNKIGNTAFILAASQGHLESLKELIAAGSGINNQNTDGTTASILAAQQGHLECLKELIVQGSEINKEDKNGWTALMIAANKGHVTAGSAMEKQKYYVVYVTSTCWLVMLTLLRDVAKRRC